MLQQRYMPDNTQTMPISQPQLPLALDAMGGDNTPDVIVAGAINAQAQGLSICLVGDRDVLEPILKAQNSSLPIHDCKDIISMDEAATDVRRRKDSSIMQGMQLVKDGKASACISMGHSGATMAAALLVLGRLPKVERPVLAVHIPSRRGMVLLVDGGANADCKPSYLQQFGIMGSALMQALHGKTSPSVGLMSIGEEEGKGNALTLAAYDLLKASPQLNFQGNVEGRDLLAGTVDIFVTDGFTGNIMLKQAEGDARAMLGLIKDAIMAGGWREKLGAWLLRPALRSIRDKLDPSEYGAQPLLGVQGYALIGHGSADARAVVNALKTAQRLVEAQLAEKIRDSLASVISS